MGGGLLALVLLALWRRRQLQRGRRVLSAGVQKMMWLGGWCYAQFRLVSDVLFFWAVWKYVNHSNNPRQLQPH